MEDNLETTETVVLNTDYKKTTGTEVTIMRLSQSAKQYGSFTYALIKGELPKGSKTYGKEGRVIFYVPKLVGNHMQNHTCNVTTVERVTKNGEVVQQVVILKSESETKSEEKITREAQENAKLARAYGLSKQDVGKQLFQAKFASQFGTVAQVAEPESATQ